MDEALAATSLLPAPCVKALGLPVDRSLTDRAARAATVSLGLSRPVDAKTLAFAALLALGRTLGLTSASAQRGAAAGRPGCVSAEFAADMTLAEALATLRETGEPGESELDLTIVEPGRRTFGARSGLTLQREADGRRLSLAFDASEVAEVSARDYLEKIERVADALAATPTPTVGELSLVTAAAREKLPDLARPILVHPYETVAATFLRQAETNAKSPAIVANEGAYSYAELSRVMRAVAAELIAAGVEPGDIVAVSGFMSFGVVAAMLAVLAAGGVVVTVDHALPEERRKLIVDISKPRFTIAVRPRAQTTQAGEIALADWPTPADIAALPDVAPSWPRLDEDAPAYVFFTSGSTGAPKGVLGAHRGLAHFLNWQRTEFAIGPGDRAAQITALSFDVVLRDVLFPLTSGAALHFPPRGLLLDARRMLRWIEATNITVMHCVPSLMKAWLHAADDQRPFRSLKYIFFAGEPLTEALLRRFRAATVDATHIVNLYGPTETTLAKLAHRVERIEPGVQPVGRPQPGVDVAILRERQRLCGLWEIGEIAIRTPYRSKGYLGRDDLTRQAFLKNPLTDDPDDLIYFTGDLGRYRSDGRLEIFGRIDSQIKIHGVRIEPNEIEGQILKLPRVRDAAVGVRVGANDEKTLVAFVAPSAPVAAAEQSEFARSIREALRQQMSEAMVPARIALVESLPYLPNGKLDRKTIAALPAPEPTAPAAAPLSATETSAVLRALVAGVEREMGLRIDNPDATFVDLGGDSLSYVRVSMLIEDLLGFLPDNWQNQPLKALARLSASQPAAAKPSLFPGYEITLLMRAVSIALVVLSHVGVFVTLNATSTLFVVSGMNFARFQRPTIRHRANLSPVFNLIAKFGIPAGLWEAAMLGAHKLWLPNLFLLGTSFQDPRHPTYTFWYLDVLAANLILFGLITLGEKRLARGDDTAETASYGFYRDLILVAFGLAIAALQVKSGLWDGDVGKESVGPFKWFWMLALGALITQANTPARKAIVAALTAALAVASYALPADWAGVLRYNGGFFFASVLLLATLERVPLPRWLHRPITVVASSTLFIFLANVSVVKRIPVESWPGGWLLQLGAAIVVGIVLTQVWNAMTAKVRHYAGAVYASWMAPARVTP